MSNDGNGYYCQYCGDELTGRQRKFCSNAHKMTYYRKRVNVSKSADSETESNEPQPNATETAQVNEGEQRAVGAALAMRDERDYMRDSFEEANNARIEAEKEAARLQGILDERENGFYPSRRTLHIFITLMVVCFIGLIVAFVWLALIT